jgi:hypothetical protein
LQNRSQPWYWRSGGIAPSAPLQPMSEAGERSPPKRKSRLGAVQAGRPAAERGGIGYAIRVLQRRRCLFPRTVLLPTPPYCLAASQQTVVGVRQRKQGKQGEGLAATRAKSASDPNPVMLFIVRLLAPATVANNGIPFANRASPQHDVLGLARPVGFDLVWRGRKWDKKNRGS